MASEIKVDTISEKTSANGITIDSLSIKDGGLVAAGNIDVNGNNLVLDANANTYLDAGTDDTIKFYVAGAHDLTISANAINVLSGTTLTIDSGATIANSGTATGFSSADPSSADGDSLGTASAEWSDLFLADGGIIKFGNDQDTLLTHTDGTGLTLNSTNKLCFNDASQFIQGSSATVLSIGATDEIDLTATAVDLNGTLNVSGVATFQATPVFQSDVNINDDLNLNSDSAVITFGADSEVTLTHVHNAGLILGGTLPNLTIGDGGTEDTSVYFDGNALDFRISLDDSHDLFEIGYGNSQGLYGGLMLDGNKHVYIQGIVTDSGASESAGCSSLYLRNHNASTRSISMADDATITPNLVSGMGSLILVGASYSGNRGCLLFAAYGSTTIVKLADPGDNFAVNTVTDGKSLCFEKTLNSSHITVANKFGNSQPASFHCITTLGL